MSILSQFLAENSGVNNLTALQTINGGPLAGLRNRIINGAGLVRQRSSSTVTALPAYGVTDRMLASVFSGSVSAGTISFGAMPGTSSGVGFGLVGATWTAAAAVVHHRVESINCQDLGGETLTVSGKVLQDYGVSSSLSVQVNRPTSSADAFGTLTLVANSGAIFTAATGVATPFSFTFTLGVLDAQYGLEVIVRDGSLTNKTGKSFLVSDLQLEIGSVSTAFEARPYGLELMLCQRYFERKSYASGEIIAVGQAISTSAARGVVPHFVRKRSGNPTITATPFIYFTNALGAAVTNSVTWSDLSGNAATATLAGGSGLVAGDATTLLTTAAGQYIEVSSEI